MRSQRENQFDQINVRRETEIAARIMSSIAAMDTIFCLVFSSEKSIDYGKM